MAWRGFLLAMVAVLCLRAEDAATQVYWQARDAEKKGDIVRAYLLYAQAAALNPKDKEAWTRSQALRAKAAATGLAAQQLSADLSDVPEDRDTPSDDPTLPPVVKLTPKEHEEVRNYAPPPELTLPKGQRNFDLRGGARPLWEQAGRDLGFDVVFDRDYDNGAAVTAPNRVKLDESTAQDLLHTLELTTNSFLVAIGDRLIIVARDTPQKRQELEPNVAVELPIPEPVSLQDAQELMRDVQQTFDLQKIALDGPHRVIYIRGAISKVRPAQLLTEQLLWHRPQVSVEIDFIDIEKSSSWNLGLQLPTNFPLTSLAGSTANGGTGFLPKLLQAISLPTGIAKFLTFGGGASFFGLGITNAQFFANATQSSSKLLLQTEIRSVEGQPATLHIGDRYPIPTTQYTTTQASTVSTQLTAAPPVFNYEDLGLTIKLTPRVHGTDGISLEVDAEFKVLGGAGINNIPIISSRRFNSKVRLNTGEEAVVAGLMTASEARNISGLFGLVQIPLLGPLTRTNGTTKSSSEVLLVIRPHLLSLPPTEGIMKPIYVGTETRMTTPL